MPIVKGHPPIWKGKNVIKLPFKTAHRQVTELDKLRFTEIFPLNLNDSVVPYSHQESDVVCIQEMLNLMACLKKSDFQDQTKCEAERGIFQNCYNAFAGRAQEAKRKIGKHHIPEPGQKKLSGDQVNYLLKQFPQPK